MNSKFIYRLKYDVKVRQFKHLRGAAFSDNLDVENIFIEYLNTIGKFESAEYLIQKIETGQIGRKFKTIKKVIL